jgi:hypothetical protein
LLEPEKDRDNIYIRIQEKELMEMPMIPVSIILFQSDIKD